MSTVRPTWAKSLFLTTSSDADAGQVIVRGASGTNTAHSFKVEDADGKIAYFHGVIANVRDRARSSSEYKGETFVIRGNSAVVRTVAAT
jgi:hypothetical protein